MSIWFTADQHLGHENIIGYVSRGIAGWGRNFKDAGEMDSYIINRWNQVVRPDDTVYVLGDFCLGNGNQVAGYLSRMAGNIKFVPGGHDKRWLKDFGFKLWAGDVGFLPKPFDNHEVLPMIHFQSTRLIGGRGGLESFKKKIVLCHYPLFTWEQSHHGSWHLHGHSHGGLGKFNRFQKIVKAPPSTLEDVTQMDVGVDAWNFYPISLGQVAARLIHDNEEIEARLSARDKDEV